MAVAFGIKRNDIDTTQDTIEYRYIKLQKTRFFFSKGWILVFF
jgi:predicted ATP-dependent endonuclease of OLD family